jgi:anti-sigma B factor antagonist
MDITPLGERLVKIALAGRLDTQGVDRVETRFTSAIVAAGNSAIVDLSKVDFVTSLGIRLLVSTARNVKMRQAKLALFGASEQVGQVFETVFLQKIIPIYATEAEALASIAAPPGV